MWRRSHTRFSVLYLHQELEGHWSKCMKEKLRERLMGNLTIATFILLVFWFCSFQTYLVSSTHILWFPTTRCLRLVAILFSLSCSALRNPVWLGLYPWEDGKFYMISLRNDYPFPLVCTHTKLFSIEFLTQKCMFYLYVADGRTHSDIESFGIGS